MIRCLVGGVSFFAVGCCVVVSRILKPSISPKRIFFGRISLHACTKIENEVRAIMFDLFDRPYVSPCYYYG